MTAPPNINQLTDDLFRKEAGKMVAVLTHVFGTNNLELSEDVVQDTFLNAVRVWSLKGIPENPSAWLMRAAKNKAIDELRRNKFSLQVDFSDPERKLLQSEYTLESQMDKFWQEDEIQDDLLRMMFSCCHPEINAENQITLVLKTLCGFSTAEIAKAFIVPEDTISKRLYRTKEFFRDQNIIPSFPPANELRTRTATVLKAIYLLFNEGYLSTHSEESIRKDLLDQSIYLCRLLCAHRNTQLPEVFAAMALMCFHSSRIESRLSDTGEIILLADQDRSLWNRALIEEGNGWMNRAAYGDTLSSYHLEAAIAWEHCNAPEFEKTNWKAILSYYNSLQQLYPSSITALNRLAVVHKVNGSAETLNEIEGSEYLANWQKNYLYYALLGDIYASTDIEKAKSNYSKAIGMTSSDAEKRLLRKKIELLRKR